MALTAESGLAIEWTCVVVSLFFVIVRLFVRWSLQYTISITDGLIVTGWLLFVYVTSSNTANYRLGAWGNPNVTLAGLRNEDPNIPLPDHDSLVTAFKLFYVAGPLFYVALWCIKAAFLIMYYQMVPKGFRHIRVILHITAVVTGVGLVVVTSLNYFACLPIRLNWSLKKGEACYSFPDPTSYWTTLAFHLLTDVLIYSLPFPLLGSLQLSKPTKLGVMCMFSLGTLCILCTIGRTISIGTSFALPPVGAWAAVEMAAGITVICTPPLKYLIRAHTRGSSDPLGPTGHHQSEWGVYRRKKCRKSYYAGEGVRRSAVRVEDGDSIDIRELELEVERAESRTETTVTEHIGADKGVIGTYEEQKIARTESRETL